MNFKVNDYAISRKDYNKQFTKGKPYLIRKIGEDGILFVAKDDRGSNTNGWHKSNFYRPDLSALEKLIYEIS